ncbi:MAG: DinB family protein [Balneolaceae bacterium]|nr:DinB family protein [Balneolaceae bacterium]
MKNFSALSSLVLVLLMSVPVQAQHGMKSVFERQFNNASRIVQLAEVMPADTYSWRPEEGVRSVGEVYTHIIQANYMILSNMGISAPEGVDVQAIGSLTDKEQIVRALSQSTDFILAAVNDLPNEKLSAEYELFGMSMNGEGVLVFLLNHMSEHVGQSIAYARMNSVTPPWNE